MSPSDFSPLVRVSWCFWPLICKRELRLRSHFEAHEKLLWVVGEEGASGSLS